MNKPQDKTKVAVVIPCYKVKDHIGGVLKTIPQCVHTIYCIDDHCPEDSITAIKKIKDPRIKIISHDHNQSYCTVDKNVPKEELIPEN